MSQEEKIVLLISTLICFLDEYHYNEYKEMAEHPNEYTYRKVKGQYMILPKGVSQRKAEEIYGMASIQITDVERHHPWLNEWIQKSFHEDCIGHITLWSLAYTKSASIGKVDLHVDIPYIYNDISDFYDHRIEVPFYADYIPGDVLRFRPNRIVSLDTLHLLTSGFYKDIPV